MIASLVRVGAVGQATSGAGLSFESAAAAVADSVLERLPLAFDIETALVRFPVSYDQSLNQVLVQEMLRYNVLLKLMRSSLVTARRALAGLQVMDADSESVARALSTNSLPLLWRSKSFPTLKPLASFMTELMARVAMLQSWYAHPTTHSRISGLTFCWCPNVPHMSRYIDKRSIRMPHSLG